MKVLVTNEHIAISNQFLSNKKLSLEAKGLLSILFSEPKLADCTPEALKDYIKDGENIESVITELVDEGYIHLT